MSPVPMSPMSKMAQPVRSNSQDSADGIRKRVCKACDRCRLKKSKCDGTSPCSRCRADNAICVFGERKKSHDKVYPKGYVEMLEQQQGQLVGALQEMYRQLSAAQAWSGPTLSETNGNPLTHDILAALNLLESKHDGSGEVETFEEDCSKLQSRLISEGAGYVHRRGSFSSDSDHSQHGHTGSASHGSPAPAKHPVFREGFNFNSATSTPLVQSPVPRQRQSFPPAQPSPLQQTSPLANDPQFYQAEWTMPDLSNPESIMHAKFAMQTPDAHNNLPDFDNIMANGAFDSSSTNYDATFGSLPMLSFPQQYSTSFSGGMHGMQDLGGFQDPMMDLEFNKFIQVQT